MRKSEEKWLDAITEVGCIACHVEGFNYSPAEPHHLLSGGRRIGHLSTIPLCKNHHRSGRNDEEIVSRHPHKRAFEKRYGTEAKLLELTRRMVK